MHHTNTKGFHSPEVTLHRNPLERNEVEIQQGSGPRSSEFQSDNWITGALQEWKLDR